MDLGHRPGRTGHCPVGSANDLLDFFSLNGVVFCVHTRKRECLSSLVGNGLKLLDPAYPSLDGAGHSAPCPNRVHHELAQRQPGVFLRFVDKQPVTVPP